ncbi:hypothetical protein HYW44_04685 [Candidatus Daviesbacteria bacterium]|nr:hypothetical protein [Candidatus Daviesbacteria bacterium]
MLNTGIKAAGLKEGQKTIIFGEQVVSVLDSLISAQRAFISKKQNTMDSSVDECFYREPVSEQLFAVKLC